MPTRHFTSISDRADLGGIIENARNDESNKPLIDHKLLEYHVRLGI